MIFLVIMVLFMFLSMKFLESRFYYRWDIYRMIIHKRALKSGQINDVTEEIINEKKRS